MLIDEVGNGANGAEIYAVVVDKEVRYTFRNHIGPAKQKAMSYFGQGVNLVILYQLNEKTLQWGEVLRISAGVLSQSRKPY